MISCPFFLSPSRFTLNSASQSPASRRAEQRQRSIQRRQHSQPQRMVYDDSKMHELGSPGKENLLPTEELSFYQSHSPQSQSPRACSPCLLCPEDALGVSELLPSENNTPRKHIIKAGTMVAGNGVGTGSTAAVGMKMSSLGYRLRRPLDEHDPNSMDSGYGASVLNEALINSLNNSSSTITSAGGSSNLASKQHSLFHFHSSSSASISRHSSVSSPSGSRRLLHSSLSSGSMESMDDMELFDMEAIDEQDQHHHHSVGSFQPAPAHQAEHHHQASILPSGLNSLICGTIKTTRTATTPEQKRPFVRRCLSLNESATNGQLAASPLAPAHGAGGVGQMKTPERFGRRAIAMEDQENLTPYSSRTSAEVTRCFKRPEPPGVSPVQSKRYKTMQFDAMALAAASSATVPTSPATNALDSPARTTVLAAVPKKPIYQKSISMNDAQIMSALARSEPNLIGDFSKSYVLPLMAGQHSDLKSISGDTMARLLQGAFDDKVESFKIIDCRYPYEFEGGHIRGAKNLYTQEQIIEELIKSKNEPPQVTDGPDGGSVRRHIVVFHCEFSSERGPKLSRFLRNHDRILNADSYPALHYPEMYLLHGGYKEFFREHADLCDPIAYRPMLDPQFGNEYRQFRAKSRSWNGDGTGTVKASAVPSSSSLAGGSKLTKSRSRLML
ncbi:AGAP003301-PA-like protein [Anopheles sinensis]|uniref:protein-tyrosine-phosphatase n=1 Tax=Anopheles sinensis TaxID=74873 RepID=A0A084VVV3_ANOSI|nr:AGAP003301-PA-like protein [Anopheles sinensis]